MASGSPSSAPAAAEEPSLEDLVRTLVSQIHSSDWLEHQTPTGLTLDQLAAERLREIAEAKASVSSSASAAPSASTAAPASTDLSDSTAPSTTEAEAAAPAAPAEGVADGTDAASR